MPRLLETLSPLAGNQRENFLTESLVFVLNLLLEREREYGIDLLRIIFGNSASSWINIQDDIRIGTQLNTDMGRPDIAIRVNEGIIVLVEVKHDSPLGNAQLERYHSYLETLPQTRRHLALLTRSRSSIQQTDLDYSLFSQVCWYEISGMLSEVDYSDPVVEFVVEDFLSFLRSKEMSMEKVSWQYIEGVPAMGNLINMLSQALSEAVPEGKLQKNPTSVSSGYLCELRNGKVYVGFRYADHLTIVFENNGGNGPTFQRALKLEDKEVHFFSLSAGEQLESLINFVSASLADYSNL